MKLLIFLLLLCGEASSQVFTGNAVRFRGRPLTACVPATGEVYVWSGTSWDCGGAGGGGTNGGGNFSASGAPAATSITKTHNANTTAVIVQCAEDVGGAEVFGTLDRSSATQTTVNFSPALANATTCVFVTGAGSGSAVADQTILGNISGGSDTPIGLTAAQVLTLLGMPTSITTADIIGTVAIGPTAFTTTKTAAILDAGASGSTATWIGHDGSGTYSGTHISAVATAQDIVAGTGQSTTALTNWRTAAGVVMSSISSIGQLSFGSTSNDVAYGRVAVGTATTYAAIVRGDLGDYGNLHLKALQVQGVGNGRLIFGDTPGTAVAGLSAIASGVIGVGTGAAGSFAGTLKLTTEILAPVAVGSLPASPAQGMRAFVTDSNAVSCTAGIGSVVAAGGSTVCPVFYDGANWRIG